MTVKCPNCKSDKIIKRGFRYNRVEKKQKYRCSKCDAWFIEDDGFKRMRNKAKIIVRAIHMHSDGLSLLQVKNHLYQYDNVRVSGEAIRLWTKKYSVFLKSDKGTSRTKT
ncbi:MAG: hypothetical protein KKC26_03900 [Nanoarchaeota archaeon]|nr:hypothetical protein [Nanoarchaeota archaeon]MBU1849109.1 hypothetical protein [Nanoarchaeota archaeon]